MENSSKVQIHGKRKVTLKLPSGKTLVLRNVLYIPDMCRNIIYWSLLDNVAVKLSFDSVN